MDDLKSRARGGRAREKRPKAGADRSTQGPVTPPLPIDGGADPPALPPPPRVGDRAPVPVLEHLAVGAHDAREAFAREAPSRGTPARRRHGIVRGLELSPP